MDEPAAVSLLPFEEVLLLAAVSSPLVAEESDSDISSSLLRSEVPDVSSSLLVPNVSSSPAPVSLSASASVPTEPEVLLLVPAMIIVPVPLPGSVLLFEEVEVSALSPEFVSLPSSAAEEGVKGVGVPTASLAIETAAEIVAFL